MDVLPVDTATTVSDRTPLISRQVGSAAGFLAISLICYGFGAVAWGWWREPYQASVVSPDGQARFINPDNVEANAYVWFTLITVFITFATSIYSLRILNLRGISALVWALVVAFVGAYVFSIIGDIVAGLHYPVPDLEDLKVGDVVQVNPVVRPGIALAASPFVAAVVYWCSFMLTPDTGSPADHGKDEAEMDDAVALQGQKLFTRQSQGRTQHA